MPPMPPMPRALRIASLLALAGCSPALDWREVRPEGGALTAWLPCKPERHSRELTLAGAKTTLELLSCSAAGSTWGIASAAVAGEAAVGPALAALRAARADNLGGRETAARPFAPPGIAARPEALRYTRAGRRPDGVEVVEHGVLFAHRERVFHVAVLGGAPSPEALEALFDRLEPR